MKIGRYSISRKKILWSIPFGWIIIHLAWYLPFGHKLIEAMYERRAPEILNNLIKGRETFPLEYFINRADNIFYWQTLFFPLCMVLFYTIIIKVFKRLISLTELKQFQTVGYKGDNTKSYGWVFALLVYIVVTLIYFRGIWDGFSSHIIGPAEDNMGYIWNIWYGWRALLDPGISFTFTNKIFYPEGVSLWYNGWSFYNLFLSFLLKQILTPAGVYNILIMHSFPLAGLGAYFLVRHFTNHTLVAITAGLIFAFNPSHLAHSLHHMNITSIQFFPFFLLFFIKAISSSSRKNLLLASIFFLLLAMCDWNWMIFAVIIMLYFFIISAYKKNMLDNRDMLKKIAVIVVPTILALSPWFYGMIIESIRYSISSEGGHSSFVVDVVAFILPYYLHPLSSLNFIAELNNLYTGNLWEATAYLGIVNIILLIYAVRKLANRTAVWSGALLFFGILSMGSYLHFAGWTLPLLFPFSIVKYIPILKHVRAPARFITLVYLFITIIVGYSLADLVKRFPSMLTGKLFIVSVILLVIIDFYPRDIATTEISLPNCYQTIITNNQEKEAGILDLPSGREPSIRYLMYQTMHGFPIMEGFIPRKSKQTLIDTLNMENLERQKDQLMRVNIKYIVWHKTIEETSVDKIDRYRDNYTAIYDDSLNLVLTVY